MKKTIPIILSPKKKGVKLFCLGGFIAFSFLFPLKRWRFFWLAKGLSSKGCGELTGFLALFSTAGKKTESSVVSLFFLRIYLSHKLISSFH